MLMKDFIGKLNSFNMDAEISFVGGDDFAIEICENCDGIVTDEGNAEKVIFQIKQNPPETTENPEELETAIGTDSEIREISETETAENPEIVNDGEIAAPDW